MRSATRGSHVRDFRLGQQSSGRGDWVVTNSIIVGVDAPAVPFQTWGNFGIGPIIPGTLITFQAVVLPPVIPMGPQVGSVEVSEIEVDIFDSSIPPQVCLEGGFTASAAGSVVTSTNLATTTIGGVPVLLAAPAGALFSSTFSSLSTLPSVGGTICLCYQNPPVQNFVGLCLYVSQVGPDGNWDVRDPLLPTTAVRDDTLDLTLDGYLPPTLAWGYTGRRWTVSLPYPIIIGAGQALHVTLSLANYPGAGEISFVGFIRSRVSMVA